jgi:hypothetical protein
MTSDAGAAPVGTRCYNRIEAGSRRFPIILDLIREGAVSLTAVRLLQPAATWPAGGPKNAIHSGACQTSRVAA